MLTYNDISTLVYGGMTAAREALYGYCPICHAPGETRERRPNGNDLCQNGHSYPSRDALKVPPKNETKA